MSAKAHISPDRDARIAALEAELAASKAALAETQQQLHNERTIAALHIAKMQARIDALSRKMFGKSSEKLDQLRLCLEDMEGDDAAGEPDAPLTTSSGDAVSKPSPNRAFSGKLKRTIVMREPASGTCCPDCGGGLRPIGEDSDEMLDLMSQAWQILQTVRPKYGCRSCDKVIQAAPPPKAIAKGRLSFATLAHIIVAKWGYHLPFYRQSAMMAAKGVEMDRSTLARAAGYSADLIDPIYNRLRDIGRTRTKLHTDDTRMPMLDPGRGTTHKSFLWAYVADDRNSGSSEPPIIWFRFTTGRAGENVETELGAFAGHLQADGFSGYNAIYRKRRIREVGCWAHWRRKFHDLHVSQPTEVSTATLAHIQQIYAIEAEIRGLSPAERLAARRTRSRPIVRSLRRYLKAQLRKMSPRSDMAKAIGYGFRRWQVFVRFLFNGQLEIDNLIAERAIRGVTVGRRNWLFAGSVGGGERAAKILSVIETCKANGIEPEAYLADVMQRIADDWPASRWDELLPWNWKPLDQSAVALAA